MAPVSRDNRMYRLHAMILGCLVLAGPAMAQLELPSGAAVPAPVLDPVPKSQQAPKKPRGDAPRRVVDQLPSVVDRTLKLRGAAGALKIVRIEDRLRATIVVPGYKLSDRVATCEVDISNGIAMAMTDQGKIEGVRRLDIAFPDCTLAFEILNGAVLVSTPGGTCLLVGEDCEGDPAGLWGPEGESLDKQEAAIDRARGAADRQIVEHYRTLLRRDQSNAAQRLLASEQVAFPAERERICRDYVGAQGPQFCAARLSEARADRLAARVAGAARRKDAAKAD